MHQLLGWAPRSAPLWAHECVHMEAPMAAAQAAEQQRGVPRGHARVKGRGEGLRKLSGHLREQNGERVREDQAWTAPSLDCGQAHPERSPSACTARRRPHRLGPKAWPWEGLQGSSRLRAAPTCSYRLWLGHLEALEWPLTACRTTPSLGQGPQREPPHSEA